MQCDLAFVDTIYMRVIIVCYILSTFLLNFNKPFRFLTNDSLAYDQHVVRYKLTFR